MKKTGLLLIFLSVLCLMFSCFSCSSINKKLGLKDDNFIEEALESVIESNTGFDIDLTPGSPEGQLSGKKNS